MQHSFAAQLATFSFQPAQTGDLIFVSNRCYVCRLIELEEGSPYSHVGLIIQTTQGPLVIEAWDKVQITPLKQFLSRTTKNTQAVLVRPKYKPSFQAHALLRFVQKFLGLPYDPNFLWKNKINGKEAFYCSELMVKILNPFLIKPIQTQPMHYHRYREDWIKYFRGLPPDGQPGVSPGDLFRQLS